MTTAGGRVCCSDAWGVLAALTALLAPATVASAAPAVHTGPVLTVSGVVADPVSYTLSELEALPAETVTLPGWDGSGGVQVTGVSLDRLVTMAAPVLPAVKNALLRVIVTVSGRPGRLVSFALGELDPDFGDHNAVVVLSVNGRPLATGPALAVPGDRSPVRDLPVVNQIRAGLGTWVAAVGSDGYVAAVTPAEAWPGGRPLLISLAEDGVPLAAPRLVTDGDVKGGRYVSGVYDLVIRQGAPH